MPPTGSSEAEIPPGDDVTSGSRQRPTPVRWLALVLVAFASSSAYLTRHALAAATTRIEADLGINSEQMGWVFSAFALGYFICQVPAGWLANRFGSRFAFAAISIVWSITAVWTSLVGSVSGMIASRFVFGNAQAGLVPISARVLRDWMPSSLRGVSSALVGAAMSLGGVVTLSLTGWLLASDSSLQIPFMTDSSGEPLTILRGGWSWRTILQVYSVVGIVWAVVFYAVFRTRPEDHPFVNEAELELIRHEAADGEVTAESTEAGQQDEAPVLETPSPVEADELTAAEDSTGAGSRPRTGVSLAMLTSLAMWGICLQSFFRAAAYQLLVTFYPKFLIEGYGLTEKAAAQASSFALLAVVIGSLSGGVVVDLILHLTGSKWASRTGMGFIALAGCGVLTGVACFGHSSTFVIVCMALAAVFAGLGNPPAWAATMDVAGDYTAEVMGVMNMAGTAGAVVFPVILGYVITGIEQNGGSWDAVLWITAVTYLLGAASWLVVNPRRTLVEAN